MAIVILSRNYINKTWTIKRDFLLMAKERSGDKVVLPVHFEITLQELALKDLEMADRFAISADKGWIYTVEKLLEAIRASGKSKTRSNEKIFLNPITWVLGIAVLIGSWFITLPSETNLHSISLNDAKS